MSDTKHSSCDIKEAASEISAGIQPQSPVVSQVIENICSSIEQTHNDIQSKRKKMEERYRNGARRTSGRTNLVENI